MPTTEAKPKRPPGTGCIYQRPDSRFLAIKFTVGGRTFRESTKTDNPSKAAKLLNSRIAEATNGTYTGPKPQHVTVSDLAKDLISEYTANGRKSLADLEARWKLHLEPFFGHRRAIDVNRPLINLYVTKRREDGAANATINRELAALKRMFNLGRANDKVRNLPVFPHLAERNVRTGFVRDEQHDALAAACSRRGLWMRSLFETGYCLGWRVSELLGLKVGAVDLVSGTIRLEPGSTKNGQGRTAPIPQSLRPWLEQSCIGKDSDRYLFSRDSDGVRQIRDFRESWYGVCCEAGVGKLTCPACATEVRSDKRGLWKCPQCKTVSRARNLRYEGLIFHDLRRTSVRNMVRSGVPERVAMTISGHLTRSVFDRYAIVAESDLRDAALKMDNRQVHVLVHTDEIQPEILQHAATA